MTQIIKRYRRAQFWSFSFKSNEYIGRLEFAAFNLLAIILISIIALILHFLLLLLGVYTQTSLVQRYLILLIISLPYQCCFFRTIVLRLRDILPKLKYLKIIIISLVLFFLIQILGITLFVMRGFSIYVENLGIFELFSMILALPVVTVLFFIPGREKPRPE
ncbi:hypothetical protein [Ignatzschineria sp. LJL83]